MAKRTGRRRKRGSHQSGPVSIDSAVSRSSDSRFIEETLMAGLAGVIPLAASAYGDAHNVMATQTTTMKRAAYAGAGLVGAYFLRRDFPTVALGMGVGSAVYFMWPYAQQMLNQSGLLGPGATTTTTTQQLTGGATGTA